MSVPRSGQLQTPGSGKHFASCQLLCWGGGFGCDFFPGLPPGPGLADVPGTGPWLAPRPCDDGGVGRRHLDLLRFTVTKPADIVFVTLTVCWCAVWQREIHSQCVGLSPAGPKMGRCPQSAL